MDKPKSWTFLLQINVGAIYISDWRSKLNQDSPLHFARQVDALAFGQKVFEPPLSVAKWSTVASQKEPNFPFNKLGI